MQYSAQDCREVLFFRLVENSRQGTVFNDAGKKIGRYLARVGSWVEEPESARLKLHMDTKNKQQQIKSGTEKNSGNLGRTMLGSHFTKTIW